MNRGIRIYIKTGALRMRMAKPIVPVLVFGAVRVFGVVGVGVLFRGGGKVFGDEQSAEEAGFFRALGWYFLAKAFFLGPMLALVAYRVLIAQPSRQ